MNPTPNINTDNKTLERKDDLVYEVCPECNGVDSDDCKICEGSGKILREIEE